MAINGSFQLEGDVISSFSAVGSRNYPYVLKVKDINGKILQLVLDNQGGGFGAQEGSNYTTLWQLATKSDLGSYFKNNDLSSYTEDCNACTRIISFINASTLNTPYKQIGTGQNISSEGLLISIKPFVSGVYNCQYVFAVGEIQGKRIYSRYKRSDSAWTTWSGIV